MISNLLMDTPKLNLIVVEDGKPSLTYTKNTWDEITWISSPVIRSTDTSAIIDSIVEDFYQTKFMPTLRYLYAKYSKNRHDEDVYEKLKKDPRPITNNINLDVILFVLDTFLYINPSDYSFQQKLIRRLKTNRLVCPIRSFGYDTIIDWRKA